MLSVQVRRLYSKPEEEILQTFEAEHVCILAHLIATEYAVIKFSKSIFTRQGNQCEQPR